MLGVHTVIALECRVPLPSIHVVPYTSVPVVAGRVVSTREEPEPCAGHGLSPSLPLSR
jgi:hypothetical protein